MSDSSLLSKIQATMVAGNPPPVTTVSSASRGQTTPVDSIPQQSPVQPLMTSPTQVSPIAAPASQPAAVSAFQPQTPQPAALATQPRTPQFRPSASSKPSSPKPRFDISTDDKLNALEEVLADIWAKRAASPVAQTNTTLPGIVPDAASRTRDQTLDALFTPPNEGVATTSPIPATISPTGPTLSQNQSIRDATLLSAMDMVRAAPQSQLTNSPLPTGGTPAGARPLPTDELPLDSTPPQTGVMPADTQPPFDAASGALAQAVPQVAAQQAASLLNPAQPTGSTVKESKLSALEQVAAETGISLQAVEQEKKMPELSPEIESFLERVEEHDEQAPQEIVIADGATQLPSTTHHPSQPVIVLPINQHIEQEGKHKSPIWSIRWLVELSKKIIKMFSGKVIYREA